MAAQQLTVQDERASDSTQARGRESLPLWYEWLVVVIGSGVASCGLIGLVLALAGQFRPGLAVGLGLVGTVVGTLLARPKSRGRGSTSGSTHAAAIAMCVFALGLAVWNGVNDGHHLFVDIDSGVNTVTAKWIAEHGDLVVHAGAPWADKGAGLTVNSPSMFQAGGGDLEFQFVHFLPVLMAEGSMFGGDTGMFLVLPLLGSLGLLAIFAVATRICRNPWIAFGSVVALGLSIPQVWASRDPYSEAGTQVVLWAGIWLLAEAFRNRRVGPAALGGLLLGATLATRIDAFLYLGPLPTLAALAWLATKGSPHRRLRLLQLAAAGAGALSSALLGAIDLRWRSTGYYQVLHGQVHQLVAALAASVALAALLLIVVPAAPVLRVLWSRHRQVIANGVSAVLVLALLVGWSIRPDFIQHTTPEHTNPTIPPSQRAEGYPVDPLRTYGEQSLRWMSWYLGPILLVLAILGLGLLVRAALRQPDPMLALVLTLPGMASLLYLWNAEITPTQIYVMRRFVPATVPLLIVAAAFGATWVTRKLAQLRWAGLSEPAITLGVVISTLVFPLGMLIPVRDFRVQAGYNGLIDQTCAAVGANAAIILPIDAPSKNGDQDLAALISQTLRSWCDVPVSSLTGKVTPAALAEVARRFADQGRTLWVVAPSQAGLQAVDADLKGRLIGKVTNRRQLQWTLNRPPGGYINQTQAIYVARVPD